jgi:hypothetical protein
MAITVNANASTKNANLCWVSGYNGDHQPIEMVPGESYFTGRVMKVSCQEIQIMSDVWGTQRYALVANDDGTVSKVTFPMEESQADVVIDITPELTAKVEARENDFDNANKAIRSAEGHLKAVTPRLARNTVAKVVKGRKVKIGLTVEVFWTGTVRNKFSNRMEDRAGIKVDGQTVWVAAQNLEVIPTEKQVLEVASAKVELAAAKKNYENVCARWNVTLVEA